MRASIHAHVRAPEELLLLYTHEVRKRVPSFKRTTLHVGMYVGFVPLDLTYVGFPYLGIFVLAPISALSQTFSPPPPLLPVL